MCDVGLTFCARWPLTCVGVCQKHRFHVSLAQPPNHRKARDVAEESSTSYVVNRIDTRKVRDAADDIAEAAAAVVH